MSNNIYLEILEKIKNEFNLSFNDNKKIEKLNRLLLDKKATYQEANELAVEVGEILKNVFGENITENILEDGILTEEMANILIRPNMMRNYEIVSIYSTDVQQLLNRQSGVGLKAMKPPVNKNRIDGIVKKIAEKEFKDTKWLLEEPIINFTQSVVDDTIKHNTELQYKSGLRPKIKRKEFGKCCDWCRQVVGEYEYPDVPDDIYKRHRYCRCTVEYLPGNGKVQDVWSKKWKNIDESDKIEERKKKEKKLKLIEKNKKTLKNKVGFTFVNQNIEKVDVDLLTENTEQIYKLEKKFGAIHKSYGEISTTNSSDSIAHVSRRVVDPLKQNLVLNEEYFSNKKKLVEQTKNAIEIKWSMPAKVENYSVYTITHEYGHILQNSIVAKELDLEGGFDGFKTRSTTIEGRLKSYEKLQGKIKKQHREEIVEIAKYRSKTPDEVIKNNLSDYGKTNDAEFFAEAFANSELGESNEIGEAMKIWLTKKGF